MSVVRIRYNQELGNWWAESEDLPGWSAAGNSFDETREQALSGAREFAGPDAFIVEEGIPASTSVWQGFFAEESNFSGTALHLYATVVPTFEPSITFDDGGSIKVQMSEAS